MENNYLVYLNRTEHIGSWNGDPALNLEITVNEKKYIIHEIFPTYLVVRNIRKEQPQPIR